MYHLLQSENCWSALKNSNKKLPFENFFRFHESISALNNMIFNRPLGRKSCVDFTRKQRSNSSVFCIRQTDFCFTVKIINCPNFTFPSCVMKKCVRLSLFSGIYPDNSMIKRLVSSGRLLFPIFVFCPVFIYHCDNELK